MQLVDNRNTTNPYLNLAIEEFLVRHADCSNTDYLLFYINNPCIVLGKNQSIYREINFDFLRNGQLPVARRISGGGTVYHDAGNLNFAFISKFADSKISNYRWFNQPLINALNKAGIPAEHDARNNIICRGKKISGNAQFTNRKNIISHGTLLFDANLPVLRACLSENDFEIETKAVQSVRSSVMNISEINSAFKNTHVLSEYLAKELTTGALKAFTGTEWNEIEKLATGKFSTYEWIYGRSPHTIIRKNGVEIEVEDGKIHSVKTTLPLPGLRGERYEYNSLKQALEGKPGGPDILTALF